MKKFAFLPIAALVFASACDARKDQKQQPVEPSIPSFSADLAGENGTLVTGRPAVCVAYDNEIVRTKAQLERNPSDADLQAEVTMLEQIITDSCSN